MCSLEYAVECPAMGEEVERRVESPLGVMAKYQMRGFPVGGGCSGLVVVMREGRDKFSFVVACEGCHAASWRPRLVWLTVTLADGR